MDWTRRDLRRKFPHESSRLFQACYRQLLQWIRQGAIYMPDLDEACNWMDLLISERVNNPRSQFYMYGG